MARKPKKKKESANASASPAPVGPRKETNNNRNEPSTSVPSSPKRKTRSMTKTKRIKEATYSHLRMYNLGIPHAPLTEEEYEIFYQPWANEEERRRWERVSYSQGQNGEFFEQLDWGEFGYYIEEFSNTVAPLEYSWNSLDAATQAKLTAFCPKAASFDRDEFPSLIQSWIWHIIYDNLFSPECTEDKWLGEHWKSFGGVQRALRGHRDTPQDNFYNFVYHFSRSYTCRMLHMRYGPHTDPARLSQIIFDNLKAIDGLVHTYDPELPESEIEDEATFDIRASLLKISEMAATVDYVLQAAPQKIMIELWDSKTDLVAGFPFREDWMKACVVGAHSKTKGLSVNDTVELILQPRVSVWGGVCGQMGDALLHASLEGVFRYFDQRSRSVEMRVFVKKASAT